MTINPAAARPEAMRRYNMSQVLREVHRNGAVTRAELTQRLGLSRSTIGVLVTELVGLDVLRESVPNGGTRAGRPSHVVRPHDVGPYVVAVDVDVTQVVTAAVGIGGMVLARHVVETGELPPTPTAVAGIIVDAVPVLQSMMRHDFGPEAIGVSVPGTVDRHSGTVGIAPNLEWRDAALAQTLADLVSPSFPVYVGNDADLSILAEHTRGAARESPDAVYLIGRFGVGAGIIANGTALRGGDGHAGEVGHNVVDVTGPPCHCGKRGCLETYIGAVALLSAAGFDGPPTTERVREMLAAAHDGDPVPRAAVATVARALGRGLASLVNTLNPQLVVLGGSLSDVLELARDELEEALATYTLEPPYETVRLSPPGLGDDSALLGAAEIAFTELLDDPSSARLRPWRSRESVPG
ncbi:ROK family protein [uncultured Jatrophihabitans sp.]|uniref:ROK family protein n=1 Tax=uncultured Jatrophihabitans sp. TaxID=1610747 RepID=UPI0035CB8093